AFLKAEAHSLKPIVQIGKNGLNDQIKTSIRQALDARELIKVTLLQNTDETIHEVAEILEEEIGCDTVLKIGRILILFKVSAKKDNILFKVSAKKDNRKLSVKVKSI
ncbi:TPA: YhbY family RNA-binding protein, partial [Streptococcus equi subsp. equi]|nr:YhbY family RNA-binding protein [Streptococcus equi subsp. equi]